MHLSTVGKALSLKPKNFVSDEVIQTFQKEGTRIAGVLSVAEEDYETKVIDSRGNE